MTQGSRLALALALLVVPSGALILHATTTTPPKAAPKKTAPEGGPRIRTLQFAYEAFYESPPKDRKSFDVWVPLPVEMEGQKVSDLIIYSPSDEGIVSESENGNRLTHVHSGPRGGVSIRVAEKFNLERTEILHPDLKTKLTVPPKPPANLPRYLKADKLVPIDSEVKALEAKVTKGRTGAVEKARAIYDYVVATMKFSKMGPGWGRGDLKYAIDMKAGNSADFNALFDGLARAAGIPARMVTGFKIPMFPSEGHLSEYHCWSEFWLDGHGWIPVDPVEGSASPSRRNYYFGNLDPDRIAYSVGRDIVLQPPQNGDPISFFLYPYAEGDGAPMTGASYIFSWKEGAGATFAAPAGSVPKP
jgi:transglutaminase-like putative cysteine protease